MGMRYSFSEEQDEFRSVLRRFLEERSPTSEVRRLMASEAGWEREEWVRINGELELTAIAIPEAYGGHGYGATEHCIVLEEMGRALLCAPYFATTVLAANAILEAGKEKQKQSFLPAVAAGETVATLAFTEANGLWNMDGVQATATANGSGFKLSGTKTLVLDGHEADLIVVLARAPNTHGSAGLSLFTVSADADGLERSSLATVDETRKLARITFSNASVELLGDEGAGAKAMEKVLVRATVCLANEMVGGADRLREEALEYVRLRMQFGRSIASFQVTKHKAADMLHDVELAKSAAYYAAAALDEDDDAIVAVASLAKATASEAYMQTAIQAIQMHGGIGFTWDNDTHLWFKRAKSSEVFLGDANHHRELMIQNWRV